VTDIKELLASGRVLDVFNVPIGTGGGREVFGSDMFPNLVAKRLHWPIAGTNAKEWDNWQKVNAQSAGLVRWFAPCIAFDAVADILIMGKTTPIPRKRWPMFLPACFDTDKRENFGIYNGHFVCHDYASVRLETRPSAPGETFVDPSAPVAFGWRMAPWGGGVREGADPKWRETWRSDFFDQYFDHYHKKVVPRFSGS
jgi:hypothetical protein